jgi:hypothetical protein
MSFIRIASRFAALPVALALAVTPLPAQTPPRRQDSERAIDAFVFRMLQTMKVKDAPAIAPLVDALLSDTAGHMQVAPRRVATPADSARARAIVRTLRTELAPFRDVAAAERAGYERFMPWLADQAIYHYNSLPNALAAADSFHVTRPSSLLYRKRADGRLVLVGVMYTAPSSASLDDLDARLPLGIATWHQHVDFCGPAPSTPAFRQLPDSASLAKWLAIETRAACDAAGGVFLPRLFGWMTHVNAFAGDSDEAIWGGHGRDHMHMHRER